MMTHDRNEYPFVTFPKKRLDALTGLGDRLFLTPSYLSAGLMRIILPAIGMYPDRSYMDRDYTDTIIVERYESNGHEPHPSLSIPHCVYFLGNGDHASYHWVNRYHIVGKNHIFWNYPGVGLSLGPVHSVHDLCQAGYDQVRSLLDRQIPATDIMLYGHSLGGGVAVQVARRLHEEGQYVNLMLDRSFARLAMFVPAQIDAAWAINHWDQKIYELLNASLGLGLLGASLGIVLAGMVATVSLLLSTLLACVGYAAALLLQSIGFCFQTIGTDIAIFHDVAWGCFKAGDGLHYLVVEGAQWLEFMITALGSVVGGLIALTGLLGGLLLGATVGALLLTQYAWTDEPMMIPMTPGFDAVLGAACCELNSVQGMNRLMSIHKDSPESLNIRSLNDADDEVILPGASLNRALETPLKNNPSIHFFWTKNHGHNNPLQPAHWGQEDNLSSLLEGNLSP